MAVQDIIDRIGDGEFDDQVEGIIAAAVARRNYLRDRQGLANLVEFSPGAKVVITKGISPKYLVGLTGKVSKDQARRRGSLLVEVDEGQYTGKFGSKIGVPAACLAKAS